MIISNDLAENILLDWKKRHNTWRKSKFITEYLKENKISHRELDAKTLFKLNQLKIELDKRNDIWRFQQ